MFNAYPLNTVPLNYSVPADTTQPDIRALLKPTKHYRLEVRTSAGVLVRFLEEQVYGAQWQETVNQPAGLQFSVNANWEGIDDLAYPNLIWLYRGDYTVPLRKFRIGVITKGTANGPFATFECADLLGQLAEEPVDGSVRFAADTPVAEILGSLLADWQTITPKIRLGHVDASIGKAAAAITFQDKSILQCFEDLHEIIGGYYWVDGNLKLNWARRRANLESGDNWIRLDLNAKQIRERADYRQLVTRLTGVVGSGTRRSCRRTATVNDEAAQAIYGIRRGILSIPKLLPSATLTSVTTAALADRVLPITTYEIDAVDLSELDPANYSHLMYVAEVGSPVRVLCDFPDIDMRATVQSVVRQIDDPGKIQVSFGNPDAGTENWGKNSTSRVNRRRDLLDELADLRGQIEDLRGDTGVIEAVNEAIENEEDTQEALASAIEGSETIIESIETVIEDSETITDRIETVVNDALSEIPSPLEDGLADAITNSETVQGAIVDATAGTGTPAAVVSTAGGAGSTDAFARFDHSHNGMPWRTANDKAGLAAILQEGELGHTTGTLKALYAKENSVMVRLTAFEVEE